MPTKLIIDTDPGIDDAMAILAAFNWEDVEVLGLTTLFGNVPTEMATENALILRDLAGACSPDVQSVPVCQGSLTTFNGEEKHRIADFVHGKDGFGNCRPAKSTAPASTSGAAQFIVEQVNRYPGEVVVLALAALTNVALAMQLDPEVQTKWKELVVLGGAFHAGGNVNPASEANIFGDPEAADYVFSRTSNTYVIGLDVTHDCMLTGQQLHALRGQGRHGTFLADITAFYLDYHRRFYAQEHVFLHDPAAMIACVRKDLYTWHEGAIVVGLEGSLRGKTVVDVTSKKWIGTAADPWLSRPKVKVALAVDSKPVCDLALKLMTHA